MEQIQYKRLDVNCFNAHSLDSFVRHQTVTECLRKVENNWVLMHNPFVENWTIEQCRAISEDIVQHMNQDQTGFGAYDGERIVGFATVSHHISGHSSKESQAAYRALGCKNAEELQLK